jgi:periplasmic protein TonB
MLAQFPFYAPHMNSRHLQVTLAVVVFHVALLWALQQGLLRRAVEMVVPAQVLASLIEPTPAVPQPPRTPAPPVRQAIKQPTPVAAPDNTPAPNAPVVAAQIPAAAPALPAAPTAAATPAPAPAKVELPSTNADYLNNPAPAYPAISKRLGEQGRVLMRVLIGADGLPKEAQVAKSSGFERLDNAAREAVMKWRYVPGKRNGQPETMWFQVPLIFELK